MRWFMLIFSFSFLLIGCSNNDELNQNAEANNHQSEPNHDVIAKEDTAAKSALPNEAVNKEDMRVLIESLPFNKMDVEVTYSDQKELEVEIKQRENSTVKATVEDELNQVDLDEDLEAFNYIYPRIKHLEISQESPKEEVIAMLIEAFDLPDDYTTFEAEFTFSDGTTVEYRNS